MDKKLNIVKNALMMEIILMLAAGAYSIWIVINNKPFLYEGSQVVLASVLQIKYIIAMVLYMAIIIWPLRLMIKFVCNIGKFKIFHKANIRIMKRIAISLGLYGLFSLIGGSVNKLAFLSVTHTTTVITDLNTLDISGFGIDVSVDVLAIISAISIIIAMIEVIKIGIKIQEENQLTV